MAAPRATHCFLLSGCSGGGKSTLLAELAARGHTTVAEAGRQVVREQLAVGGDVLPWQNAAAFLEQIVARTSEAFARHRGATRPVFFDRGLIEAVSHYETIGEALPPAIARAASDCRFAKKVFVTPPWPQIYVQDAERRHSFEQGVAEYEVLIPSYERHGYEVVEIPKAPVAERADFVLREVAAALGEES